MPRLLEPLERGVEVVACGGEVTARATAACASSRAASHAVDRHISADRRARSSSRSASSMSAPAAQAITAGTRNMIEQNGQMSSHASVASASSTRTRAIAGSGAAMIMLP